MSEYKQQDSIQRKCPNCGAFLKYDPESGNLICEHCNSTVEFEKSSEVHERDFDELVTFQQWADSDVCCYRCSNCGAVSVASRTSLATTCPYCGSPVVIEDQSGGLVKPDSVVPFEVSLKQAAMQLSTWRNKKLFAPRKFRKETKEDSVKGVYIPAWTFDAETMSDYRGTVGYHRTRTVRRDGKTYTETYTEWRHVHGQIGADFDDIFVRANGNISESNFQKLQPFPQDKYKVFNNDYLAGYMADHYTLEPLDAFERAKEEMLSRIRHMIVVRYHADVEGTLHVDMNVLSKSFKYILLPVYVATTKYNGKVYNQFVSGVFNGKKQTCKVCGKAPVSVWKVLVAVLLGIGAFIGLVYLLSGSDTYSEFGKLLGNVGSLFKL